MKIQKLSPHEAQKIAAGEVVERPANIVKELLENSLDAGASAITITVEHGGKNSITVTDNGCGMEQEDARICFERHTTSKIRSVTELETVKTFGFRGEALASICSVAQVTITTKPKNFLEGIKLSIEGGKLRQVDVVGCPVGTTISIHNLFYNVPARKKFLKTTATEWGHIVSLFKACALSNPQVHFRLVHDTTIAYNCPPVKGTIERIAQLFDTPLTTHIVELSIPESSDIKLSGAVTTQQYARYDRGGMFFFVNGRWVKNYQLGQAVTKGYLNVLSAGRYPAAVIHLELAPHLVDINVHPKKEEIQFLNPRTVQSSITQAVKTTLEHSLSQQLKRTISFATTNTLVEPLFQEIEDVPSFPPFSLQSPSNTSEFQGFSSELPVVKQAAAPKIAAQDKEFATVIDQDKQEALDQEYSVVGHYHNTYILLEKQGSLLFIDQHAAHERILYERFANRFEPLATVRLLFPIIITLSAQHLKLLEPHLNLFEQNGISAEQIGDTQLAIKATPVFLKDCPIHDLIDQMLGWIEELQGIDPEEFYKTITEKLRAQMACKAAIKAGDSLSKEAMEELLHDLTKTKNRFSCPHGRPTSWELPLLEVERRFKRKT